jgi:uncharacterized protein YegP (UPF0339 family)
MATIHLVKDKKGQFRFNIVANNGEIVATSESYKQKPKALATIKMIQAQAGKAKLVDKTEPAKQAAKKPAKKVAKKVAKPVAKPSPAPKPSSAPKPARKPAPVAKAAPVVAPAPAPAPVVPALEPAKNESGS